MKTALSRIDLMREYEQAPDSALFSQETVAALRVLTAEKKRVKMAKRGAVNFE